MTFTRKLMLAATALSLSAAVASAEPALILIWAENSTNPSTNPLSTVRSAGQRKTTQHSANSNCNQMLSANKPCVVLQKRAQTQS